MIYAGIGARDTPDGVLKDMRNLGQYLSLKGHILRSGGAKGADSAFESGCDDVQGTKEIYLPWRGFNRRRSRFCRVTYAALDIAQTFHPKWSRLSRAGQLFMGRNVYQVLGQDMETKCDFIVCWTPGGKVTGGTGQALRMANYYKIPIVNLASIGFDEAYHEINRIINHP